MWSAQCAEVTRAILNDNMRWKYSGEILIIISLLSLSHVFVAANDIATACSTAPTCPKALAGTNVYLFPFGVGLFHSKHTEKRVYRSEEAFEINVNNVKEMSTGPLPHVTCVRKEVKARARGSSCPTNKKHINCSALTFFLVQWTWCCVVALPNPAGRNFCCFRRPFPDGWIHFSLYFMPCLI